MVPIAVAGVVLALGLWFLARGFVAADPRALARALRYGGIALGAAVVLFLVVRGQVGPLLMLGAMAMPLIARMRRNRTFQAPPAAGQTSRVETSWLRMTLDHDSGAMGGEVLGGPFAGRTLDSLSPQEMAALLEECRRDDPQSAALVESWLDRTRPDWRERMAEGEARAGGGSGGNGSGTGNGGGSGTMTRAEAFEILGLPPEASAEQIREAHRRLMMGVHPDHGGSTYLAAKLNQAKDLLLRH